jgi:hypothetical protein
MKVVQDSCATRRPGRPTVVAEAGKGRGYQRTLDSRSSEVTRHLLGSDVDDYLAISPVVAMFPEIDTLPGS